MEGPNTTTEEGGAAVAPPPQEENNTAAAAAAAAAAADTKTPILSCLSPEQQEKLNIFLEKEKGEEYDVDDVTKLLVDLR
ncbi:hypothetical protein EMWEY_00045420 [Eimeria maxima]|uniref:Uncharacterized protein n=1 Tax=Eimeria maxima TaxID=5804 RepID=U6MJJ3_EIMMA|nr:hypothetical protein EMWEY_00045420 [Eimeria maxima]CDJ61825.1 hypothetical protein EMWEY_00045420 [Eimeria maxima]